ncbi:MAG: TIGR00725 family protein [Phycisphaerae bacterium]
MKTNRRLQVAVIGSSEADARMLALAEDAGRIVARLGAALVTGGRDGIMAAASKACAEAGGVVLAVTPHTDMNDVNPFAHYHIPTGMGWARNVITGIAGDVMLVIGGAAGTLSEIAYAWMYDRPIVALSCSGGWAARIAGQSIDHRRDDVVIDCQTIAELEAVLKAQLARAAGRAGPGPR